MGTFRLSWGKCTAVILLTKFVLGRVQSPSPVQRSNISVALIFAMQYFADIFSSFSLFFWLPEISACESCLCIKMSHGYMVQVGVGQKEERESESD